VISGRVSKGTDARLRILKVKHIYQHRLDKAAVFAEILKAEGLEPSQALYVGDDLPDLAVMTRAGLAVAPRTRAPRSRPPRIGSPRKRGGRGVSRNDGGSPEIPWLMERDPGAVPVKALTRCRPQG